MPILAPEAKIAYKLTETPATLPRAVKKIRTGKNALGSSPPMLNSKFPERVSSDGDTTGIDQSKEWEDVLRAHSPIGELPTVGYEPAGRGIEMVKL